MEVKEEESWGEMELSERTRGKSRFIHFFSKWGVCQFST